MSSTEALSLNVRRLRVAQLLSMRELARRAEVSPTNIVRIEGGDANPQLELLDKVAKALNTTSSRLLASRGELNLHPLALRVALDVDQAFRDAKVSCEPTVTAP